MADEVSLDDLEDLWRAGATLLPTVAIQYSQVATSLHQSALNESGAFGARPIGGGAPSYATWGGPLSAAWTRLRDVMQDEVAVRTYQNLLHAGQALKQIAESYATTDYLNQAQIDQFHDDIQDFEDSNLPDEHPPDYVPDAPSTTDPHPEEQQQTGPGY